MPDVPIIGAKAKVLLVNVQVMVLCGCGHPIPIFMPGTTTPVQCPSCRQVLQIAGAQVKTVDGAVTSNVDLLKFPPPSGGGL